MSELSPPIDYTTKDYHSFRRLMLDVKKERIPQWTSESPNDFGVALIEAFSYVGDILSFYGDRIANEAFLATATQRSSVLSIARMLDYHPTGNTAATVTLTFTKMGDQSPVTIPAGTQVSTPSAGEDEPIVFETDEDLTITDPDQSGTVTATQGETVTDEVVGSSDGTVEQRFPLFRFPVVEGTVSVAVDDGATRVQWDFITHLLDATENDAVYTLFTDENGVVWIEFGDGVNGRVPPNGADILASYRVGGGEIGNVSANTITYLVDPVFGVQSVNNSDAAFGGSDAETLEEIRQNVPRALQALDRAVTVEDYASLALQVPKVGKTSAEAASQTAVTVYLAPPGSVGGRTTTQATKDAVDAYLEDRKMINVGVTLADPTYVNVNVTVSATVRDEYRQIRVQESLEAVLSGLLEYRNVDFADRISVSEVYRAVQSIDGVDYATVTKLIGAFEQQIYHDADSGTFTLSFDGAVTAAIDVGTATAATIETELEALANITDVTVTGSGTAADPWAVRFITHSAERPTPLLVPDSTNLTGGTATVANDGVADVITRINEIPQVGTITLNMSGGIVGV